MTLTQVSCNKIFGGFQKVYTHESSELKCSMKFAVFLPAEAEKEKCPLLYYLSGLTCTEQNFISKAGAQQFAAQAGVILVAPDTSPRGCNIPGEDDSYDFGSGAGFYVDATQDPWKTNYRMFSYITKEFTTPMSENIPNNGKQGVFGHSMGGHGALVLSLKCPELFQSVSAFAPIANPCACPWGEKAFTGYLGSENRSVWKEWDACELLNSGDKTFPAGNSLLVDQGAEDEFLAKGQLLPDNLSAACAKAKVNLKLRMQPGYDHSYYFVATFMEDHIKYHAKNLK